MGCIVSTKNNSLRKDINKLGVVTEGYTEADITVALTNLSKDLHMEDVNTLLSPSYSIKIKEYLFNAKERRLDEKQRQQDLKENIGKIKGYPLIIGEHWKSGNIALDNKDTLFIFSDNAQAFNTTHGNEFTDESLVEPTNGVKINVSATGAVIRTNSNGEINENAKGIVTKLNAQNKEGKFIGEEGFFTDKQKELFIKMNEKALDEIVKAIDSGKYKKVSMSENFALSKAGLTKDMAETLAKMMEEKLGISTTVERNTEKGMEKYYGIKIHNKFDKNKVSKEKKSEKETKEDKLRKEALESLKAQKPLELNLKSDVERATLSRLFPNIEQRDSITQYITSRFSERLTAEIKRAKDYVKNLDIENSELTDVEKQDWYDILLGLTRGTEAEQRVFALANLFQNVNGEKIHLAEKIFNDIKMEMLAVIELNNKGTEALAETIQGFGEYADLFSFITYEFNERMRQFGIDKEKQRQYALNQARELADVFNIIVNTPDVFDAFIKDAAFDLEFNENIRLSFDNKTVVESQEDLDNIDEEGKVDDRSGLNLVKYKLMNPAKSLSVRMKTLLGSLYKTSFSQEHGNTNVFNSLGYREKINPQYAYYILLDEFTNMRNPNDMDRILDRAMEKYPWVFDIKYKLEEDTDLRNEFYRAMKRSFMPAAMITNDGHLKKLNLQNTQETFLNEQQKNYEGHVTFSDFSIYDEAGECNESNVNILGIQFKAPVRGEKSDVMQDHTFYQIRSILGSRRGGNGRTLTSKLYTVDNILEVLDILRGNNTEYDKKLGDRTLHKSLESMLNALGIDTKNFNMDAVIPYIDRSYIYRAMYDNEDLDIMDFDYEGNYSGSEELIPNDKTELEALETYFTPEVKSRLQAILTGIYIIVASSGKYHSGQHLSQSFTNAYSLIGRNLTMASEGFTQASYSFNGKQRFSYNPPDFINEMTSTISNVENERARDEGLKYITENYLKYDFLKDNIWMQELAEDIDLRANFRYYDVLGIRSQKSTDDNTIQNVSDTNFRNGLIEAMFSANDDKAGNSYGFYRNPLFSDTDALVLIQAKRYTGNAEEVLSQVKTQVAKVIDQEVQRILDSQLNKGDTIVENYNDSRNNSGKFNHFPQLNEVVNGKVVASREVMKRLQELALDEKAKNEYLESLAENILREQNKIFIDSIDDRSKKSIYDHVRKLKKGDSIKNIQVIIDENDEVVEDTVDKKTLEDMAEYYDDLLSQYFYNDYFGQIQLIQILGGDLAYYKDFRDFIERNKQSYASGERIWSMNEDGTPMMNKAIYLHDWNVVASSYNEINELLNSADNLSSNDKAIIRGIVKSFDNIKSTDGQSLRTLKSFRKVLKAMGGKWTDDMERAYNNIINQRMTIDDFNTFWQSIKPFVFTHEDRTVNGRLEKVTTQYKNSEYMLSAIYSILNTALNKSPLLKGLHQFMDENDIDVAHFHSSVKVGFNTPLEIDYNNIKTSDQMYEALNNQFQEKGIDSIHSTPMSDYMIVQPSDDHLFDAEAVFGSQLRNIMPADLPADFTLTVKDNNGQLVKLNREEAIQYYNTLITDNLIDSFSKLNERFSDSQKLANYLDSMTRNNPKYGEDVRQALQLDKNGNFRIPLNSPTLTNKIEELVLSAFKNAIQRQKIKGGNAVLVSNFGLSDDLHVEWNDAKDPSKGVKWFEVYMPFYMKNMVKDYLVKDKNGNYILDQKALESKQIDENLLKAIAFRIPTENKYSAMPIKIKGFLPMQCGSTMMFPNEYIVMSGTDFDFNKCFLMFKESNRFIAPKTLAMQYKQWLGTDLFDDEKKLLGFDKNDNFNHGDYTEDEINSLIEKSGDFADFWEEKKHKIAYKKPIYKEMTYRPSIKDGKFDIDANSKMNNIKSRSTRRKMRNNVLFDIIWGTLTSPQGSRLMMNNGNYDNVKHGSRQQDILNDTIALQAFKDAYKDEINEKGLWAVLNSKNTNELEEFYNTYSSTRDPNSITTYLSDHRNLMDGNALIGAFAINSASHYKFQFLNLTIQEDYQFKIQPLGSNKAVNIEKIDSVNSVINDISIGRICAEYQAASPDNGKDPCLGALGINLRNVYLVAFLARIGLDPQSTGVILKSSDLFLAGAKAYKDMKKKPIPQDFDGNIANIVNVMAELRTEGTVDSNYAAQFYIWRQNIDAVARALNDSKAISKVDSPNNALPVSVAEVIQQKLAAEDFMKRANSKSYPVQGFQKFIDINLDALTDNNYRDKILASPIPRQQAFYTLGINSARNLAAKVLPTLNDSSVNAVRMLREQTKSLMTSPKYIPILKKFLGALTTYMLSYSELFGKDYMAQRNYYIHDFPMKLYTYLNAKDKKGKFIHTEMRNTTFMNRIENSSGKGIFMRNVSIKTSPKSRKHFNEEFESLGFSDDKEVSDLTFDLIRYSY